jgi:subtilase family serine protease
MHPARLAAAAIVAAFTAAALAAPASVAAAPSAAAARAAPAGQEASSGVTVRPDVIRLAAGPSAAPLSTAQCQQAYGFACLSPGQLRAAYQLPALYVRGVTGTGSTIMIVDPFGSPTIKADLAAFDRQFGYPAPPAFTVIAPVGKIPAFRAANAEMADWAQETTLDVEYAHALAPGASILLVETPVAETEGVTGFPQIVKAEQYAMAHYPATVISQSFSATEPTFTGYPQLAPLRAAYLDAARRQVTVLAASGDSGATDYTADELNYYPRQVTAWPGSDPLVTAVGGTQVEASGSGYTSVAWNDTYNRAWNRYISGLTAPSPAASGGGRSEFFARPAYQNGVEAMTGAHRGVPDIAMSAGCDGAVSIYSSYSADTAGWTLTCGTSEATPEFAAVVALAAQLAGRPLGQLNPVLYRLAAEHAPGIVDVTSGNNTVSFDQGAATQPVTVPGYPAGSGYDLVTGVGTVNAAALAYELAGS